MIINVVSRKETQNLQFFKKLFFFGFLIFNSFLYSQKTQDSTLPPATLVLKNGANIYSQDQDFNAQIQKNKVDLQNSELSYQKKNHENVLKAEALPGKGTVGKKPLNLKKNAVRKERQSQSSEK